MKRFTHALGFAITATMSAPLLAQGPVRSPEVSADRRVTFRFRAPNAKEVFVGREGGPRMAMQKDERGIWTATTEPLEPDFYGYSFIADGVSLLDPGNSLMKPNLLSIQSMVHVPGSQPWDVQDVPHGTLNRHFHKSSVVGDQRDFYVYTPPGYDAKARKSYPVLYLCHGFSDDASGWTSVGRAHVILDNLIAQGKAKPMLVVMALGYGAPEIVAPGGAGFRDQNVWRRNVDKYRDYVMTELIPEVEKHYNVSKDRGSRAIAGLSMGGAESLFTGLNNLDKFAWIGAFSSGGMREDYAQAYPALDEKANDRLKLLWIACGTEDGLIAANRKFEDWLTTKNIKFTKIETPGAHTWLVWRRNLATFVPLLFQDAR